MARFKTVVSDERPPEAQALAMDIDHATVRLNSTLVRAEQAFAALKLGVTARTSLYQDEDYEQELVFCKYGGAWCLMLDTGPTRGGEPDEYHTAPIGNASREVRVRAVSALPRLYQSLLAAAAREAAEITEAVDEATQFLNVLSPSSES